MGHPRIMQKQWSLDEVRQLRELARQKLPLIVIARKLRKSPGAVASKSRTNLTRAKNQFAEDNVIGDDVRRPPVHSIGISVPAFMRP